MHTHSVTWHIGGAWPALGRFMERVAGTDNLINPFTLSLAVMGTLVVLSFLAGRSLRERPGPLQNMFEVAVDFIRGIAQGLMGAKADRYLPLFFTLFMFILGANLIGLIPALDSPTASISVNAGLALVVLFSYHFAGIRTSGLSYFRHFMAPRDLPLPARVLLFPLFLIIEGLGLFLIRPLTLTLRLTGNIRGKEILLANLAGLIVSSLAGKGLIEYAMGGGFFVLRFMILVLGVLVSLIQAAVFTILTIIYIGLATEEHEEHGAEGHGAHPAHAS